MSLPSFSHGRPPKSHLLLSHNIIFETDSRPLVPQLQHPLRFNECFLVTGEYESRPVPTMAGLIFGSLDMFPNNGRNRSLWPASCLRKKKEAIVGMGGLLRMLFYKIQRTAQAPVLRTLEEHLRRLRSSDLNSASVLVPSNVDPSL